MQTISFMLRWVSTRHIERPHFDAVCDLIVNLSRSITADAKKCMHSSTADCTDSITSTDLKTSGHVCEFRSHIGNGTSVFLKTFTFTIATVKHVQLNVYVTFVT